MLNTIIPLLSERRANKVLTKYSENFMSLSHDKIENLVQMNINTTKSMSSGGIEYISTFLRMADTGYYRKSNDDIGRLIKIEKDLPNLQLRDPWTIKSLSTSQSIDIIDIILPTRSQLDFDRVPIGSNDWTQWSRIHPLRMVHNNTTELSMYLQSGRLFYQKNPPLTITYILDVPLMILAYCKYLDLADGNTDVDMYKFVYNLCIVPLLHDAFRCWNMDLIGLYTMFLTLDPDSEADIELVNIDATGKDVVRSKDTLQYHEEIVSVLKMCQNGAITPVQALNSLYIGRDETIFSYCHMFNTLNRPMGAGNQFLWQKVCSELWLSKCVLSIYNLQPNSASSMMLVKALQRTLRSYKRRKLEQHIKFPPGHDYVKEAFDDIVSMMER